MLPDYCYLATGKFSDNQNVLTPAESKCIDGCSPRRKQEFVAGRSIAKKAANILGSGIESISRDNNGCPLWPATVVGSISHKMGFCGALIGYRDSYTSIGLDIELVEHMQKDVWGTFAATHEIEQALACNIVPSAFANLIFSAKEAYFKCLYPIYYPENPTLSEIFVTTKLISNNYLETEVIFDDGKYYGGIAYGSKLLISWALKEVR